MEPCAVCTVGAVGIIGAVGGEYGRFYSCEIELARIDDQIHVFILMRETEMKRAISLPHLVCSSNIF